MHKKWWREFDSELQEEIRRSPDKTLVISAFNLSQMATQHLRKQYIHEMWSVGAETMVGVALFMMNIAYACDRSS